MDSLTQFALGATIGDICLSKRIGNKSILIGGLVASIPDLDILLVPFFSEFQKISLHRGFSHSILFSLVGAFLISSLLKRSHVFKDVSHLRSYMFCMLALSTHILLDCFTTYGTQIFSPFNDTRISFDSIGIIDPAYSLPLIAGLLLNAFYRNNNLRISFSKIGLILSSIYLIFTLLHKGYINQIFNQKLISESITEYNLLTVPVYIAGLEWYGVAKTSDSLYISKYSHLKKNRIEFEAFPINDQLLIGLDSMLVDRLKWFSKDFYTVAEKDGKIRLYNMQCDMQGIRNYGDYKAPTAFYYEISPLDSMNYILESGMHSEN